jgi:hypothetical protein
VEETASASVVFALPYVYIIALQRYKCNSQNIQSLHGFFIDFVSF